MDAEHEKFANELYVFGLAMRNAQREYFKLRTKENLYKALDAEKDFDRALRNFANVGHPLHPTIL